ncbi:MAG: GNAT family N-acetyltransferase [Actinomycetaceae bacterium]|nr:GNAT family N-acetyltransferase [Actinomycetaceae bacterium]
MSKQPIHSHRVYLRQPTEQDVETITRACQDELIQRFTTVPVPYTQDSARWWINQVLQQGENERSWLVFTGENTFVGVVGIEGFHQQRRETSIGYWGAPEYRGRGLMYEACQRAIEDAWDNLEIDKITWSAHEGNVASWKLAWKLGFVFEGVQRNVQETADRVVNMWTASLLRSDSMSPNCDLREPMRWSARSATGPAAQRPYDPRLPQALVQQFHEVYGLPVKLGDTPNADIARIDLRMGLISEEYAELIGAVYGADARKCIEEAQIQARELDDGTRDTIETADALGDLIYVLYGMGLETGIDLDAVLDEVQASNLSKLGADGQPIFREDGKVLKGPGYFPPNIAEVLGLVSDNSKPDDTDANNRSDGL